ncbi:hypothetical protein EUX98_g4691 [Antrodiella citrinella]|uniref:AB hydrolase-1 domain-containing protein n=1 Tax=Antrodiella citrinella TaxID=2447956 RepID=A0A4S4MVU4_9APHY|nr:hypothetical protein EUX98_g4691 [Antrodiella citrinella]
MQLLIDSFLLTGKPERGSIQYAYKRYRNPYANLPKDQRTTSGVALLLIHCINTHKETWEPTIESLFELQSSANGGNNGNIVEVWSMDSPNHGYAAYLNEEVLFTRPEIVNWSTYSDGLKMIMKSGLISGDHVIGVGHSAGATCVVLSLDGCPLDRIPYSSLILVEPPMLSRPLLEKMLSSSDGTNLLHMVIKAVLKRKDVWSSREEARQFFAKRYPWKKWDPRVLDFFIDYGLRDLPTATYPDRQEGVTLACPREQEAATYTLYEGGVRSLELLSVYCPVVPVHCIIGGRPDLISDETRAAIWDVNEGRRMASIATVEGAGHMVAQESPHGTADAIWNIVNSKQAVLSAKREMRTHNWNHDT